MLSLNQKKEISNLFDSISKDEEFEIMFNNYKTDNVLSLIDFMNVVKYIKYRSSEDKLKINEFTKSDEEPISAGFYIIANFMYYFKYFFIIYHLSPSKRAGLIQS